MGALLTVPPLDVEAMANAIVRLAASPEERSSLGERGRARVIDGFMLSKSMREVVRRVTQLQETRCRRQESGVGSPRGQE